MEIRTYRPEDLTFLMEWWSASGEVAPEEDMLPPESTFVLEIDGNPALSVSLFLPNIKSLAWVENFIGNPKVPRPLRREATMVLLRHIAHFAKVLGYRRLFCMGTTARIGRYYERLGFQKTARVSTYTLEIE